MVGGLRARRPFAILLAIALFIAAMFPSVVNAAEAAGKAVEVRVKVGSGQMTINKEKVKIQAPYLTSNTTMVPLSVFTNAKGFAATLKPSGKNLQLTYLKHTLVLTKGSKSATFDGKKATLPVAPVDKSSVTMVPLVTIAKALELKVTTDSKTKELVIKGTSAAQSASGSGIDSDAGKNKVGDSYYKWSMNLPTNLAQDQQWGKGSRITFVDVKGEFYMAVFVDEAEEALDAVEQREWLKEQVYEGDETIVDVSTVKRGSDTFQKLITKNRSGFFYEYRGIQRNNNYYTLVFGKKAKAKSELDSYKSLLDSFETSFDKANKSLKDLSIVKNGMIAYKNEDYGLKLQLPVSWSENQYETEPTYYGPNEEIISLSVYSVQKGDTLEALVQRDIQSIENMMAEPYRKILEQSAITWNGVTGMKIKYAISEDSKTWHEFVVVYAIQGNYKYNMYLYYPQKYAREQTAVLKEMLNNAKVDFNAVEKNFGQVPDPDDTKDWNATITKTSKKYGYSVTLPKHWLEDESPNWEQSSVQIHMGGFVFIVETMPGDSIEGLEDILVNNVTKGGILKKVSSTAVTYAGTTATKLEFASEGIGGAKVNVEMYFFSKNGVIYVVQNVMSETYATPFNLKQLEDTMQSFTVHS